MIPIKNYEVYSIDCYGNVYNTKRQRMLKPSIQTSGYKQVALSVKGFTKYFTIHKLVARHYIPNPENKPQVNHKNGNKSDNRVENLEWVTSSENIKHSFDTGLRKSPKNNCKKVKDTITGKIYDSTIDAANSIGMKKQDLINRLNGKVKNTTTFVYL